jgi:hypothetical protein
MLEQYLDLVRDWLLAMGFTKLVKNEAWQVDSIILFLGLGLLGSLATGLYRLGVWWYRRRRQYRLRKDLHPYFSAADIRKATQHYVPTHFQSNPPSQHHELIQSHKVTARQKLIPFFLNHAFRGDQDEQRFYIVLAGSGMGKTTFMLNLYLAYLQRKQLGRASFHVRLMPLGYPDLLKRIEQIQDQANTILLLDGLDEDTQAIRNYKRRLERMLSKVKDFRYVVFTCRTQFFPSEEEEPRETGVVRFGTRQGFQTFAKLYLSPFDDKDIQQYLRSRYGRWQRSRKDKARRIIDRAPNLVVRPMILSYIDDLINAHSAYELASDLYAVLIDKWIDREASRVPEERREQFREELYRFSREVAINIYKHRRHRKGLFIGLKEIKRLGEAHDIRLEEMEMQSRSLLNRNVLDQFKFAHKSILEYFLAREAVDNAKFTNQLDFQSMDQARLFYDEMCMQQHTLPLFEAHQAELSVKFGPEDPWQPVQSLEAAALPQVRELRATDLRSLAPLSPLSQLERLLIDRVPDQDLNALSGMTELIELQIHHSQVESLAALAHLLALSSLDLRYSLVADASPLRKLSQLSYLDLSHSRLHQLDALQDLLSLETLLIAGTTVKDLTPLRKLQALRSLDLRGTPISGLTPLRDLTGLQHLDLAHTQTQNLNPLRGLSRLQRLDLTATPVTNLAPLKAFKQLQQLHLDGSDSQSLDPLRGMAHLSQLSLVGVPLADLQALRELPGLTQLTLDPHQADALDLGAFARLRPHCQVEVMPLEEMMAG